MDAALNKTLQLVFSSTRPMPAHFTSNGDRKQSFCIDFEPLDATSDYNMAATAWGATSDFLSTDKLVNEPISKSQFNVVVRCGEDLMVGAFILSKLGGSSLMSEMKKTIIDDTIETFSDKIENVAGVLSGEQVQQYFDYCVDYGRKQVTLP